MPPLFVYGATGATGTTGATVSTGATGANEAVANHANDFAQSGVADTVFVALVATAAKY